MDLYVGLLRVQVDVYDLDASGDAPPKRALAGEATALDGVAGMALDNDRNLYVGNAATSQITVYAPDADGDVPPIRIIAGDQTRLAIPESVALDSAGSLYVLNSGGIPANRNVTVYPPGASGNVAPIRTISGIEIDTGNLHGIAIDSRDYLYVAEDLPGTISVYEPESYGHPAAVRRISGANTRLSTVSAMDFDANDNLYVANGDNVLVFASGADGDEAPMRVIGGPQTGISENFALAVDPGGVIFTGNAQPTLVSGHVNVFAAGSGGNVAPIRTITNFQSGPPVVGMAIDKPRTPRPHFPHLPGLAAQLLGGVSVDGGGYVVVGGIPIPIGPWGPLTADNLARGDLVVAMAIEQLATHVRDEQRRGAIRAAALDLMKAKVNELIAALP